MLYIVFLIGTVILAVLFLTSHVLKALKENDQHELIELQEQLKDEKAQALLYKREDDLVVSRREQIDKRLLHIRLDLIKTEDDLKDVIPRLLN
jgi:predicted Holliday junction resolvase-like endonuclease